MKNISIIYNPFLLSTKFTIDGKKPRNNSSLDFPKQRLQEWAEKLPEILDKEYGDKNFSVEQRQNLHELKRSESRIREIEMALSSQQVNAFLAEQNTGRFMEHFTGKYPNFVPRLQERNAKLTKQDLTLCALIALGESNESIQEIRHISKESLWAARYRLRSKLQLQHDQRLEDFLRETLIQG